jgi:hypothetical protein
MLLTATVAYGMTMGPNGAMTVTGPNNITATITAPPGSTVGPTTITPLNSNNFINLPNTHWNIMNESSGSMGTITFKESCHEHKGWLVLDCNDTFSRFLNGRTLKGVDNAFGMGVGESFGLCYGYKSWNGMYSPYTANHILPGCTELTLRVNHPDVCLAK